ncbi:MAG: four helix bundle protein [Phycisphaerales bacterium]|nr:four helix bundle protein [Phycisphaerales bacterium]
MGRLPQTFLMRVEDFSNAMVDVAERLVRDKRFGRIADQVAAAGSSVGANAYEADEAMSRADFAKTMCIVMKELNESRFWLRLCVARSWLAPSESGPLQIEAVEIKNICGAIVARTRENGLKEPVRARKH